MKPAERKNQRSRCAGATLSELMIATTILGMVFASAAFIQSMTAKQTRVLYSHARTLGHAHQALDLMRYKLGLAEVGTAVVRDGGRTLEFVNPNLRGPTSAFKLEKGKVYYYADKTQAASVPSRGIGPIHDLMFDVLDPGGAVSVTITTLQRYSWKSNRPCTFETEITLRN